MKNFLAKHLDDALVLAGEGVMIFATWLLNPIAALYVGGVCLILWGVMVGYGQRGKVK